LAKAPVNCGLTHGTFFFVARTPINNNFNCLAYLQALSEPRLDAHLAGAAGIADRLGCYDAGNWLKHRAADLVVRHS
jgi:hypothetical protein